MYIAEEKLAFVWYSYQSCGSVLKGAPPEDDASLPFWFWFEASVSFWFWFWRDRLFPTMESLTSPASTSNLSVRLRLLLLLLLKMRWVVGLMHIWEEEADERDVLKKKLTCSSGCWWQISLLKGSGKHACSLQHKRSNSLSCVR